MIKNDVEWEMPKCNLCGKQNFNVFFENVNTWLAKGNFRIVKCKNCNFVYLSPRPKASYIKKYYPAESYWGNNILNKSKDDEYQTRDRLNRYIYKSIFSRKKGGFIVDIGAGTALFLTKFKEMGWKVDGVELSKHACRNAKKKYDITLKCGDYLNFKFLRNSIDVVSILNCLEHLYYPKETLMKVSSEIKKDGTLVITIPNIDSIGSMLFGKNWYALQPPTHLSHFSPITITKMLKKSGFIIEKINHFNLYQNYYILFETIRLKYSKKYINNNRFYFNNGVVERKISYFSIKNEFGKFIAKIISLVTSLLGAIIGKGEILTIYAKKD